MRRKTSTWLSAAALCVLSRSSLVASVQPTTRDLAFRMQHRHHIHIDDERVSLTLDLNGGGQRWGASRTDVEPETQDTSGISTFFEEMLQRLKIGCYFAVWYALNVVYNIVNKKVLNVIPAPLTIGTVQFLIGALYASSLWALHLRSAPKLTALGKQMSSKVGFYHMAGQLFSMVSLGAGPISFTHIVKALEPFFSAAVSVLVFGKRMKPQVYITLLPVVGGVAYACMNEPNFGWLSFLTAMGSNLAFALRAVVSKSAMTTYIGKETSSANLFGVVTWFAFFFSIPVMILGERDMIFGLWSKAVESGQSSSELVKAILLSGLFHYLNNEVMYLALGNVHPVTLAVGNTMKRVFILVASFLVFRNPVSGRAAVGSSVGILGVFLYSLTKAHFERLESLEASTVAVPYSRA